VSGIQYLFKYNSKINKIMLKGMQVGGAHVNKENKVNQT
jgi:hypothetical protein